MVDSGSVSDGLPGVLSENQVEMLAAVRGRGHHDLQKMEGRNVLGWKEGSELEKGEEGGGWEMGAEGTFTSS